VIADSTAVLEYKPNDVKVRHYNSRDRCTVCRAVSIECSPHIVGMGAARGMMVYRKAAAPFGLVIEVYLNFCVVRLVIFQSTAITNPSCTITMVFCFGTGSNEEGAGVRSLREV